MTMFGSSRLSFRELRPEDVSETYIGWMNDPAINLYLETRFARQDRGNIEAFVRAQLDCPNTFLFRISGHDDDSHIGNIKLGPINRHHASAHISLLIGERSLHGRGYATEAISRVTRWGFEDCGLHRIEAGCYAENLGSLRAFLKAGYTVEGFRRESVITVEGSRSGAFWLARLTSDPPANR